MKKFLLFPFLFALFPSILMAQEPYRQLIITEAVVFDYNDNYTEITNVGDQTINLKEFKYIGDYRITIPEDLENGAWVPPSPSYTFWLPDYELEPGESYVIAPWYDFGPRQYRISPDAPGAVERPMKMDLRDIANKFIHYPEDQGDETDSVTPGYLAVHLWGGNGRIVLEHHFAEDDSAAVDVFNTVDPIDGQGHDVAGIERATNRGPVMRKATVTEGNLDFANARGVHLDDSEWMAIPYQTTHSWRDSWWTIGNHGAHVLDENTLKSDVVDIDFAGKTITVPWGIRRLDGIMRTMAPKPGVAWYYHLNEIREDSVYQSVRTGDKLEVFVTGNTLYSAVFDINVNEPAEDANRVVPITHKNLMITGTEPIASLLQYGILSWPRVTEHATGPDTISGFGNGLEYDMRTDTLLKYLEKPSNATWEFVWVDDTERANLKDGDKLKVTAQNGTAREYYIQVQPNRPSNNAFLSSITWPDIPDYLKGIFGWQGDTIPNFSKGVFDYRISFPSDIPAIPALIAHTEDLNATVQVKRADSFSGNKNNRTISFTVTASDQVTQSVYNIELVKEKEADKVQPYFAEPFVSEIITGENNRNGFLEIYNPGNQPIDLSNYMFNRQPGVDIAERITSTMADTDFDRRYRKYVPGYKFVSEAEWPSNPGVLIPDLSVNTILQPGEIFIMAVIPKETTTADIRAYASGVTWPPLLRLPDIQFILRDHPEYEMLNNPWGEEVASANYRVDNPPLAQPRQEPLMIFKILNDSVQRGLKPVNDPGDYELIEAIGMADGSAWRVVSPDKAMAQWTTLIRKPEVYQPNAVLQASFGETPEESEWLHLDTDYWSRCQCSPYPNMQARRNCINDYGKHVMIEPTHYKSTVSSLVYKVSDGYSMEEEVLGVLTGTTADEFLSRIIRDDENQTLTVLHDESALTGADVLASGDVLEVISADEQNTTRYIIDVSEEGLSSDALLSSTVYTVTVDTQPGEEPGTGSVTGFEYGTRLSTVLNNISIPSGATMEVTDSNGAYVPSMRLNFDTVFVDVTVNSDTYLEVLAEDGLTRIIYQLIPASSEDEAFVMSDKYMVTQNMNLIEFIPRGTRAGTLLSNLFPATGATMKVFDKLGQEKPEGALYEDDKVVVTSASGTVNRVYHLGMLRTEYITGTPYLAYLLSPQYNIDQLLYTVHIPSPAATVTEFNSNIVPAAGATAVLVDSNGDEKTTGEVSTGDMVKVTSADGKMVVMYGVEVGGTHAEWLPGSNIRIYPNPASERIHIAGVEPGVRMQLFNQWGMLVKEKQASANLETMTFGNQPAGIYFLVLTRNSRIIGQYKVLRR